MEIMLFVFQIFSMDVEMLSRQAEQKNSTQNTYA